MWCILDLIIAILIHMGRVALVPTGIFFSTCKHLE